MASNRGYTTAVKVKNILPPAIANVIATATVEEAINRVEGVIDSKLKVTTSSNIVGANTLAWTTANAPHWVIEGAATFGAAMQCCGPAVASLQTLDQLVTSYNTYAYMFKVFMDVISSEDYGTFVVEQ